jgi:Leucine-rich repeat (LRR) protein
LLFFFSIITDFTDGLESTEITDCEVEQVTLVCYGVQQGPVSYWSNVEKDEIQWSAIQHLKLNWNGIESLSTGFFTNFTNLTSIDLRDNKISAFDFDEFGNNPELIELRVDNNQISEIKTIRSSTVVNITKLTMSNNDLNEISELCKVKKLVTLDLSRNRRLDFNKLEFNCWSELNLLFLAETNLKSLHHDYRMLTGCNKLTYLDLMDNNLEMLRIEKFPALPALMHLNIRNNSLVNLDVAKLKEKFQNLLTITVTGNKWSCDYYAIELKKQLTKFKIQEGQTFAHQNENLCLNKSVQSNTQMLNSHQNHHEEIKNRGTIFVLFWIFMIGFVCIAFEVLQIITFILRLESFLLFLQF